jgi:hypothetical protein
MEFCRLDRTDKHEKDAKVENLQSRRPLKISITVFLSLVIFYVIAALSLFFGLRQYIV